MQSARVLHNDLVADGWVRTSGQDPSWLIPVETPVELAVKVYCFKRGDESLQYESRKLSLTFFEVTIVGPDEAPVAMSLTGNL